MPKLDATALHEAVAQGDRDGVVEWLLGVPHPDRLKLRGAVRKQHDAVVSAPTSSTSFDGSWHGKLTERHWSAAAAALLGCSTLAQAVKYAPLDMPDAHDLPKALFADDLEVFVAEWSARYLRNPKAWDRIRGLEAMFDWAHDQLVAPPLHDGAVLLLLTAVPANRSLLNYLEARPVLIRTTLLRLFDVDGIKGASPAQMDEHFFAQGKGLHDHVIPTLIRRGHWSVDEVEAGIDRALGRNLGGYQHRWFTKLRMRLDSRATR